MEKWDLEFLARYMVRKHNKSSLLCVWIIFCILFENAASDSVDLTCKFRFYIANKLPDNSNGVGVQIKSLVMRFLDNCG